MMEWVFEQIRTEGDRNFGYLIGDRTAKKGLIIDPSYAPDKIFHRVDIQGLKIKYIIDTHGHSDHVNGNKVAKKLTGAPIAIYHESNVAYDIGLKDGDVLKVGKLSAKVYYTPGHATDHIVLYLQELRALITGDHLFVGKIGGTATSDDSRLQFDGLQKLLKELPEDTTIWPGHDFGARPSSTFYLEKNSNPFLQAKTFEEFLSVKENWKELKQKNGLL